MNVTTDRPAARTPLAQAISVADSSVKSAPRGTSSSISCTPWLPRAAATPLPMMTTHSPTSSGVNRSPSTPQPINTLQVAMVEIIRAARRPKGR